MNLQTQEDGAKYQRVLREVMKMTRDEIIRILDLALEQSRAEACNGCAFADTEEWEEPCKRCKRNYRDYWRRGKQNG